jgi:hypothetical protein
VKAVPLQMPSPSLTRLLEPYGTFSPMGVLYDVPVKLFSFHLVLMSLIAPDASRETMITRPSLGQLVLDGTLNGRPLRLELRSVPLDSFLLVSRRFHWIQEYPYNR